MNQQEALQKASEVLESATKVREQSATYYAPVVNAKIALADAYLRLAKAMQGKI
jgi:hypothetical protein